MDCKDLKIPICDVCKYNSKFSAKMSCEVEWYNIHLSHIKTKEDFKYYIINTILTVPYIHNFIYLRYTVEKKFPQYINIFETILLLK